MIEIEKKPFKTNSTPLTNILREPSIAQNRTNSLNDSLQDNISGTNSAKTADSSTNSAKTADSSTIFSKPNRTNGASGTSMQDNACYDIVYNENVPSCKITAGKHVNKNNDGATSEKDYITRSENNNQDTGNKSFTGRENGENSDVTRSENNDQDTGNKSCESRENGENSDVTRSEKCNQKFISEISETKRKGSEKNHANSKTCPLERIALIFGASSGIGLSTALLLIKDNFTVFNASRRPCPLGGVINIEVDVVNSTGSNSVATAFEAVNVYANEHADSRLELVVYSAGFSMAAPMEMTKEIDYRYLFEVNFFGFVTVLQHALPIMRNNDINSRQSAPTYLKNSQHNGNKLSRKGSRIIVVSSMGGVLPLLYDPFYCSSKSAIDMLVREVNLEVNQFNIYLTSIQAGGTCTEFTAKRKTYDLITSSAEFNNIDVQKYAEEMAFAVEKLADIEQRGVNPVAVAKCIVKTLKKKKPPIITQVGFVNKVGKIVCALSNNSANTIAHIIFRRNQ